MAGDDAPLEARPTATAVAPSGGRRRRAVAALGLAALLTAGACAQDTSQTGVEPADQEPLPPQQPSGGDDPTLSGTDTEGVGDGQTGGQGSGSPDSGAFDDGTAGEDSPTGGEDG